MNRENKRKQYEKGYYKTHPCQDGFTCKVCGRLMTPENAGCRPPESLPQLPVQPACGHRARRPRRSLRRDHGAGGGVGAQGRRVGHHPPLPPLRSPQLQPSRRRTTTP